MQIPDVYFISIGDRIWLFIERYRLIKLTFHKTFDNVINIQSFGSRDEARGWKGGGGLSSPLVEPLILWLLQAGRILSCLIRIALAIYLLCGKSEIIGYARMTIMWVQ